MAKLSKDDLIDAISEMTVLELSEMVKALEDKFGVTAAAPVTVAAMTTAAPAAEVEEQSEFTVNLTSFGADKIGVIKVVRELTGLGLKEAKELVDGVPKPIKENISKEEAATIKSKLEAVGASVEVK